MPLSFQIMKEASDMVLVDDNLSTVASVVGDRRLIYNNMELSEWLSIIWLR